MSLICLIAALLLQKFRPFADPDPLTLWLHGLADWIEHRTNAGQRRYGVFAWFAVVLIVFLPVTLAYYLLHKAAGPLGLLFAAVVLYLAIRFRSVLTEFSLIQHALRQNNIDEARDRLGKWLNRPALQLDKTQIAKAAIEYAILNCYRGLFGVLFWFLLIPGPGGALVYRAALVMVERWRPRTEADEYPFSWFAVKAFEIIDWLPQRLTAVSFAIVGDFEDALYCWRSQAQSWGNTLEGVVLAASAGALGVRLGDPLTMSTEPLYRPPLGLGEEADLDYMQSAEGLIWRAVVLWSVVLLLLGIIQIIA
ncbi:MAG: CobD/CbiB family protein [Pseudomonadota bacterium]